MITSRRPRAEQEIEEVSLERHAFALPQHERIAIELKDLQRRVAAGHAIASVNPLDVEDRLGHRAISRLAMSHPSPSESRDQEKIAVVVFTTNGNAGRICSRLRSSRATPIRRRVAAGKDVAGRFADRMPSECRIRWASPASSTRRRRQFASEACRVAAVRVRRDDS
jgi:hypothetical protein